MTEARPFLSRFVAVLLGTLAFFLPTATVSAHHNSRGI